MDEHLGHNDQQSQGMIDRRIGEGEKQLMIGPRSNILKD